MFNFPNTPSLGDAYQPTGGPVYQWDGEKWVMTGSPLIVMPAYDQRNRIVNPAMQISQENGNTAVTVIPGYPVDQWQAGGVPGTFAFSAQRIQSATPKGSANRLRTTVTTAQASLTTNQNHQLITKLEGIRIPDFRWGSVSAKQVILRFGWKSPAGTWSVAVRQSTNRSFVANFTVSAAQANADTEQTIVIPGDTAGTWPIDNTDGLSLTWPIGAGPTLQGVAGWQAGSFVTTASSTNGMATAGNVFELFDVGLYLDANNSGIPPAWEMPDEAQELAACQRYFAQNVRSLFSGNCTSGSSYNGVINYPVMRAAPVTTGVSITNLGFPAAVGSFGVAVQPGATVVYENRVCNVTGPSVYMTHVTLNARM